MHFIKNNQVNEARRKLLEAIAKRLQGGYIEPLGVVNIVAKDAVAWLITQEDFK